jgi:pimeloyl-ACP methyl ester carboxylesterase
MIEPTIATKWVHLEDLRVRYLSAGTGPPLVLVHGLAAYAFSWRLVIPALAQHFTVYALDIPGSGFSDPPPDMNCSLEPGAKYLLQALDALQISSCDLLATSYGGAMAMVAASIAPDRIKRLILAAPVNPWSAHGRVMAPLLSNFLISPLFRLVYPRFQYVESYFLRRLFGSSMRIPKDSLEGYANVLRKPGVLKCALKTVHSWNEDLRYLERRLVQIRHIPTLLLWGDKDRAVFPQSALQLQQQLTNSKLVVFQGIGHLPYEEIPGEFGKAVLDFLNQDDLP